jgi:AraC family transcriptional regulator
VRIHLKKIRFFVKLNQMLYHTFPDLQWLKNQAENRFANRQAWGGQKLNRDGWPTVILNVKTTETFRDNIPGPLSLFSTVKGKSAVTVDNKRRPIPEDYFFLTNAGQRYTLEVEKNQPSEIFNIHFGQHWAEEVILSMNSNTESLLDQPDQADGKNIQFYNKLFPKDNLISFVQQQLLVHQRKGSLKQKEILYPLMIHLLQQQQLITQRAFILPAIKSATREEILRRLFLATDYIHSCYDQSLSLEELARISCLSKFHFLRLFKKVFQQTPHEFITEVRIEKAKQLLKGSHSEIKQIARQLGFENASSFSRLFFNRTKTYPSMYRSVKPVGQHQT